MFHPIYSTVLGRHGLVADHLADDGPLARLEAQAKSHLRAFHIAGEHRAG